MKMGPFSPMDVDTVTELLKARAIEFELIVSEKVLKDAIEHHTGTGKFFRLGNKAFWFEIADKDFAAIEDEMLKYGVTADSDGSYELGGDNAEDK